MTISFQDPWMLLLLLAIPATVALSYRSVFKQERGRRWVALTLRILMLFFLSLALAGMQVVKKHDRLTVLYVMDVSKSVESGKEKEILKYINDTADKKPVEDRVGLIVFGSEPSVEKLPREKIPEIKQILSYVGKDATDIGAAIRLANAVFPEDTTRRMVLITDGNENRGAALEEARTAAMHGTTIDILPLRYQRKRDVVLEEVVVPNQVQEGETFDVRVVVSSDEEGEATVHFYRDSQYLMSQKLNLIKGKKAFTIPQQLRGSGFHTFEAKIESASDKFPDNNRGGAVSYIEGRSRILIIEGDRAKGGYLARALSGENLEVDVRGPDGIPMGAAEWQNYDAVILSDLSADNLSYAQMQMIESNVHDLGMGLAMVGGENSFGAGGYLGSPIENALPVNMDVTQAKVQLNGAVVFIVDHIPCIGDGWTKEICIGTLRGLSQWDLIGLIHQSRQDQAPQWLFPIQRAQDKPYLEGLIQRMYPGSVGTMERPFTMARDGLIESKGGTKHIVVITNGYAAPPSDALVESIRKAKISMSVAVIEPWHGNQQHLSRYENMVKGSGGNFKVIQPGENAKVPEFYIKEKTMLRKGLFSEEKFQPIVKFDSEIMSGIGRNELPTLNGYNATGTKKGAEIPIVSKDGDPILAHWRYGLGKTVAFTSDAKNRWAGQWLGWEKFGKFWSQTAKWILRTVPKSNYRMSVHHGKTLSRVVLDAIGEDEKFVNFLKVAGTVVSPDMQPQGLGFRQVGPGRYEAEFRADQGGIYMVNVRHQEGSGPEKVLRRGFSVPYALEFRDAQHNEPLMKSLVEIGRGRIVTDKTDLFDRTGLPMTESPQNLWPFFLTVALLIFPLDIFVRRVMLEWAAVAAWIRRTLGIREAAPAPDPLQVALQNKRRSLQEAASMPQTVSPDGTTDLPILGAGPADSSSSAQPSQAKAPAADVPQTHISRLLRAKGRAFKNEP